MLLSVVIPAFNEESVLPQLFGALNEVMDRLDCDCAQAIRWFAEGRLRLIDGIAHLDGKPIVIDA